MATLKISDISVGDWVRDKGKECTVASIYMAAEGYPSEVALTRQGICSGCAYIDYLEPIPITAEILEKNGFESTTNPNVFTLTHGELQLYVSKEFDGWYMSFVNFRERLCILQVIRQGFIHQLQHALRLAGVDKEINL